MKLSHCVRCIKRLDGYGVWADVHDSSQLEAVDGMRNPHLLPTIHDGGLEYLPGKTNKTKYLFIIIQCVFDIVELLACEVWTGVFKTDDQKKVYQLFLL